MITKIENYFMIILESDMGRNERFCGPDSDHGPLVDAHSVMLWCVYVVLDLPTG